MRAADLKNETGLADLGENTLRATVEGGATEQRPGQRDDFLFLTKIV